MRFHCQLPRRGTLLPLAAGVAVLAVLPLPSPAGGLDDDYRLHPRREGAWTLPAAAAPRGTVTIRYAIGGAYSCAIVSGSDNADGLYLFDGDDVQVGHSNAAPFRSVTTTDDPDCLWVGGVDAVHLVDVSDPANPQVVDTVALPGAGDVGRVSCKGDLLLADGVSGKFRLTLAGPCGPVDLVDPIPGVPSAVTRSDLGGGFAGFITPNSLTTVNLAVDPIAPVTISVPGTTYDVAMDDGGNVVLAGTYGVKTFTISSSGAPIPTGDHGGIPNLRDVTNAGSLNRLLLRDAGDDIHLVDVQPGPVLARTATVSGPAGGSGLASNSAFTLVPFVDGFTGDVGMTRIGHGDRHSPAPHQILTDTFVPRTVRRLDDVVLVLDSGVGLRIYDGAVPANLADISADSVVAASDIDLFRMPSDLRGSGDFRDLAFVGTLLDLRIVEFTDPANPVETGVLGGSSSRVACAPDGGLAVRSDSSPGFRVVDVTDPAAPFDRGSVSLPNAADDLVVDGSRVLVASFNRTARFDVSDPDAPVLEHATPYTGVRGIALAGTPDQAYLGIPGTGGRIIRYDFAAQTELSSIDVGANTLEVSMGAPAGAGGPEIVYAAEYLGGSIFVIDWTDPADPMLLGEYTEPGFRPGGLALHGGTLIAADNSFPGRIVVLPAQAADSPDTGAPLAYVPAAAGMLAGGAPNPFTASTTLELTLPRRGDVRLSVHDLQGRRVRTLLSGPVRPGRHAVAWDGRDGDGAKVASGVYFVRLEAQGRVERRKLTVLR